MLAPTHSSTTYRFGVFQVNPRRGELLKRGVPVKLQGVPFQLLTVLLERPGDIVSREELRRELWPEDTHVGFDDGLNVAASKLRIALGDSADNPVFVETIPRRGYKFIAPVSRLEEGSPLGVESGPNVDLPEADSLQTPGEPVTQTPSIPKSERARPAQPMLSKVIAICALCTLLALATGGYFFLHRTPILTGKDRIVIADFTNTTGDAVFDGTLRLGLSVQLEQSPVLSIVSDEQIQKTLQLMGQSSDSKLTPTVARELCQRTGSAAVLNGSIAQIGTHYLLTVKAFTCSSGDSLASAEAVAGDKNHVLDALDSTAFEIRNKLGESLSTIQRFDTPLEQATTPSLEALQAFNAGQRVLLHATGNPAGVLFLKRAIELDPNFALAYAYLGIAYTNIGEPGIAAGYTKKAYELRDRTSDPEKYFISAVFAKEVTGNIDAAERSCKLWIEAYPRAEMPHIYLSGAIYPVIGQYKKGADEAREAIRLKPDLPVSYAFLIENDISLNRLSEARSAYEQALEQKLSSTSYSPALYQIAFLQSDPVGMAQQAANSVGQPGLEDELMGLQADTAGYSGKLGEARELSRRAMDSALRSGEKETAATYSSLSGLREALFGNSKQARRQSALAMGRSAGRDAEYGVALALAFAGDDEKAKVLTGDLAKGFPEDTIVQLNYLPTLRGKLAVNRGNAVEAIDSLGTAASNELGQTTGGTYRWTALYSVFVRGEAYLVAHQPDQAAAEFQKILDHPGIVVNSPIGAMAHLQLGRAFALSGDKASAKAAYQDFLTLWKDADHDIPILKEAKAEYARLQ